MDCRWDRVFDLHTRRTCAHIYHKYGNDATVVKMLQDCPPLYGKRSSAVSRRDYSYCTNDPLSTKSGSTEESGSASC